MNIYLRKIYILFVCISEMRYIFFTFSLIFFPIKFFFHLKAFFFSANNVYFVKKHKYFFKKKKFFQLSFATNEQPYLVCNFIKKEALAKLFSGEFCETSKNIFFLLRRRFPKKLNKKTVLKLG